MVIGDLRFPIFLHITHRRTVGALSDPCCPIARFDTVISKKRFDFRHERGFKRNTVLRAALSYDLAIPRVWQL